jgi:hypothetical protein
MDQSVGHTEKQTPLARDRLQLQRRRGSPLHELEVERLRCLCLNGGIEGGGEMGLLPGYLQQQVQVATGAHRSMR